MIATQNTLFLAAHLLFRRYFKTTFLLGILILAFGVYKVYRIDNYGPDTLRRRAATQSFNRVRPPVDCVRLIEGDEAEQRIATRYQKKHEKIAISNKQYIEMTTDCDEFVEARDYITNPVSEEEENFPLAFSILVFKDVEQFERLLRAVYRPQNFYCVHVDKKAEASLHKAVNGIAECFDNVLVLQNNVKVKWGTYSVLEADILCMEALLKYKKWKYFINLTGQEFPLRTNLELVHIIKVLNGANLIGATMRGNDPGRLAGRPPPPIDVGIFKGSVHIVARREFVEYAINNENARMLLNWTKLVRIPDEMFFSTLNHNPQLGIPGTYLGTPEYFQSKTYPLITRLKIWTDHKLPCHGIFSHFICIFGVRDLPLLATTPHLIANKFHLDFQPLALDCLEELIYNRTQEELQGNRYFDTSYYQKLDVVKNHL